MPDSADTLIAEAHEERIQTLEKGQQHLVGVSSGQTVEIQHLKRAVEEGFSRLEGKVDEVIAPLAGRAKALEQGQEEITEELEKRMTPLEHAEKRRADRNGYIKKAMAAVALAGVGVLAKVGFDRILLFFSH